MLAYTYNPSTQSTEAGEQFKSQPRLCRKILSKKKKETKRERGAGRGGGKIFHE